MFSETCPRYTLFYFKVMFFFFLFCVSAMRIFLTESGSDMVVQAIKYRHKICLQPWLPTMITKTVQSLQAMMLFE